MVQAPSQPRLGAPDAGVSEVVGSILMVAITVALAGAMFSVVYGAIPGDGGPRRASLSGSLDPGDGGWGTGDESFTLTHRGGHGLPADATAIVLEVGGNETRFAVDGDPIDHAEQTAFTADDRNLTIGERWTAPARTIDPLTDVAASVVDRTAQKTIWSAGFEAGTRTSSFVQTPLAMVTGTVTDDGNARSATDGSASATLAEERTGTRSETANHYATSSTGTATRPADAGGGPDDAYAVLDADGETVEVTDASSHVGTITKVELALEGRHDGATDQGTVDGIRLGHDLGSTTGRYPLTASDSQRFLDVTGDRARWTWSDVENLTVQATCECRDNPNDAKTFRVDALWVRVTADVDRHELETDAWTFDEPGPGDRHQLEIRYRADTAEDYRLQIWDGSAWTDASTELTRNEFHTASEPLTDAQVDAGPRIRLLDQGASEGIQGTIELDHVRVISS